MGQGDDPRGPRRRKQADGPSLRSIGRPVPSLTDRPSIALSSGLYLNSPGIGELPHVFALALSFRRPLPPPRPHLAFASRVGAGTAGAELARRGAAVLR